WSARSVETTPACRHHCACTVVSERQRGFGAARGFRRGCGQHASVVSALQRGLGTQTWSRRWKLRGGRTCDVETNPACRHHLACKLGSGRPRCFGTPAWSRQRDVVSALETARRSNLRRRNHSCVPTPLCLHRGLGTPA